MIPTPVGPWPSIRAMARDLGISRQTISARLTRGERLDAPLRKSNGGADPVALPDGRTWPSIRAMARELGISHEGARKRFARGTFDAPRRDYVRRVRLPITDPEGRTWRSVAALASAYSLPVETLRARLRRGIPVREAVASADRRFAGSGRHVTEGVPVERPEALEIGLAIEVRAIE